MPGFFGVVKKTEGFFWVARKGLRDFFGYAKKVTIFLGRQILKLRVIFLGIKYEPLLEPPLSLKFVSGTPGGHSCL